MSYATIMPRLARNYAQNVGAYALAAHRLLDEEAAVPSELQPAFYLLAGFGVELGLKTLCLAAGAPESEVKAWRHDLGEAMQGAFRWGALPQVYSDVTWIVEQLQKGHEELLFRYTPDVAVVQVPEPVTTMRVLNSLAHLAHDAAWASEMPS